jgi:hypothetical protein
MNSRRACLRRADPQCPVREFAFDLRALLADLRGGVLHALSPQITLTGAQPRQAFGDGDRAALGVAVPATRGADEPVVALEFGVRRLHASHGPSIGCGARIARSSAAWSGLGVGRQRRRRASTGVKIPRYGRRRRRLRRFRRPQVGHRLWERRERTEGPDLVASGLRSGVFRLWRARRTTARCRPIAEGAGGWVMRSCNSALQRG